MLTFEKYFDDGQEAADSVVGSFDGLDYKIGIMINTTTGDSVTITIRGKEAFAQFAESLIDVVTSLRDDDTE